ncbi:MAG: ABC transporter ATP-binding protein [Clostridia bacterium]|nr:ABC transporter ATP-binding protein [Clostridia bacterium]
MKDFINLETSAIKHSAERSIAAKKNVLAAIPEARTYFGTKKFDKKGAKAQAKKLSALVAECIDKLDIVKDSATYTFDSALNSAIDKYFLAVKNNPKEEARFKKQSAKREKLIKRGKTVDWKVVPAVVYDLDDLTDNILKIINNIATKYENDVATFESVDFSEKAVAFIDFLKEMASLVVYKLTKRMAKEKAIKLMDEVGIPDSRIRYNQYPFEFSGGMRQRIVIAIALSANPDILICDEPTTALDVTIQAQILELINNLKKERNLSVIFITHDLGVVANIADKIAVMYAGKIVEYGTADDIFYDPRHPYTWALLSSMPDLDTEEKLEAIPGTPPNMIYPPVGDAFAARNKYALKIDFEQQPPQFEVTPSHWAATWLLHPEAPKVEPPHIIMERIERMKKRGGM